MTEHTDLTGTIRTLETERDGTVRYRVTEDRVYADDLRILTGHLVGSRTGTVTEVLEPADDDEPVSFEEEVGDDLERRAQAEQGFDVSEEERASARAEAHQLREANRVARAQMGRILADRAAVIRMCDQLRDERDQLLAQLEGGAHDARAAVRAMSEAIRRAQEAQRLLEGE